MTKSKPTIALFVLGLLTGCASAEVKPAVIQALNAGITLPVGISAVTIDAANGVWVSDEDRSAMQLKIRSSLDALPIGATASPGSGYTMHVVFTRFDRGSAFARLSLIGLGQIHMEGTVSLTDSAGKLCAQYAIRKTFALGGLAGGFTSPSDVEDGFAKSVAAIFAPGK